MSYFSSPGEYDYEMATKLGISAAEPGFACVRVAPNLASNKAEKGVAELPIGPVFVDWSSQSDRFSLTVEVPVGIHLQVRLPARLEDTLYVDGEPIAEDTQTFRSKEFVELAVLPGNRYVFEVLSLPISGL